MSSAIGRKIQGAGIFILSSYVGVAKPIFETPIFLLWFPKQLDKINYFGIFSYGHYPQWEWAHWATN